MRKHLIQQKGTTILETIISLAILSIILLVSYTFFAVLRGSYLEQIATVQCQASARTAENHIIASLRRCDQAKLYLVPEGSLDKGENKTYQTSLTLTIPSENTETDVTYKNQNGGLIYSKDGADNAITDNIDPNDGVRFCRKDNVIHFIIETKQQPLGRKAVTFQIQSSHHIRVDKDT